MTFRNENLFLIGPMGAGKTTIGRQLARALDREFVDADHEIIERTGVNIPTIFDIEGEEGFRRRERDAIDDLTRRDGIVLATGGGAVLSEENRKRLSERGTIIYLQASIDQILKRTSRDRNRPLLQTEDPRTRLEEIMAVRGPIYQQLADIVVDTDSRTVKSVVREILSRLPEDGSA